MVPFFLGVMLRADIKFRDSRSLGAAETGWLETDCTSNKHSRHDCSVQATSVPVADERLETAELYNISKLKVLVPPQNPICPVLSLLRGQAYHI